MRRNSSIDGGREGGCRISANFEKPLAVPEDEERGWRETVNALIAERDVLREQVAALEVERAALEWVARAADEHLYDSTGASTWPPMASCRALQRSEELLHAKLLALPESVQARLARPEQGQDGHV